MERILLYIKHKLPFLWYIIELFNISVLRILHGKKISKVQQSHSKFTVTNKEFHFRYLGHADADILYSFLSKLNKDYVKHFSPHSFEKKPLHYILKSKAFLTFGYFYREQLIGYFMIRLFANRKAFTAGVIDPDFSGKGIGKDMSKIMYGISNKLNFNLYATTYEKNIAALKTYHYEAVKKLPQGYLLIKYGPCNKDISHTQESIDSHDNSYAHVLRMQGKRVFTIEGVDWFEYKYFITPAYLPHCIPVISNANVEKALKTSKTFFARWESDFGSTLQNLWWHIVRKDPWSLQECSKNTRRKIQRGRKKLHAKIVSPDIIASKGYAVCQKAIKRYNVRRFFPGFESFQKKVLSAQIYPEKFQFFGVFSGTELVAFCENYLQENAVLWDNAWYDPQYLRNYSSYVLIDAMLNYYLNNLKVQYVSSGNRNIYHKTNVQNFMIENFGFIKEYSRLHVKYSPFFGLFIRSMSLLSPLLYSSNKFSLFIPFSAEIEGLYLQEEIRKSYSV